MKRVHIFVSGVVQGVGFRKWTQKKGRALQVTGWVKNRNDGSVEVVGEGDMKQLELFVAVCREGPPGGDVRNSAIYWEKATGEWNTFLILGV